MKEIVRNTELIGRCGLFCGACDNYLAFKPGKEKLLENEKFQNKENEYCEGCNSEKVSAHCSICKMRLCAIDKNIISCGDCECFPCTEIVKFKNEGDKFSGAKHRKYIFDNINEYRKTGCLSWLANQDRKWTCKCGTKFSFYERNCQVCGTLLESYAEK